MSVNEIMFLKTPPCPVESMPLPTKFWYFTFLIVDKEQDYRITDWAGIASEGELFPIGKVHQWATEEFGESVRFMVMGTVEVSEHDYKDFITKIGVE